MMKSKLPGVERRDITFANMAVDAYYPPGKEAATDNIAEVLCQIIEDDGPRPMARLRPAKKVPNAADHFNADHQLPYEAYGARSLDRVQAARMHNTGYPKMHDELRKKRSTGRVAMTLARRNGITQRSAYARVASKSKKRLSPKRRAYTYRHYMPKENKRRNGPRRTTITKPKARPRAFAEHRKPTFRSKRLTKMVEKGTLTYRNMCTDCKDKSNASQYSDDGSSKHKNPDTDASISSYNSYASLEHEPMVVK